MVCTDVLKGRNERKKEARTVLFGSCQGTLGHVLTPEKVPLCVFAPKRTLKNVLVPERRALEQVLAVCSVVCLSGGCSSICFGSYPKRGYFSASLASNTALQHTFSNNKLMRTESPRTHPPTQIHTLAPPTPPLFTPLHS